MKWRLDDGQIEVVDEAVAAILRTKTPAERLAMAFAANETARALIAGRLRTDHPDWTDAQVKAGVARRMMGEAMYALIAAKATSPPSPLSAAERGDQFGM